MSARDDRAGRLPVWLLLGMALLAVVGTFAYRALPRPGAQPAGQTTAVPGKPVQMEPAEILRALPPPAGDSASDNAIAKWAGAAGKNPGDFNAWLRLGDALAQKFRDTLDQSYYPHADRVYRQALTINPRAVEALTGLAWVYGSRHEFEQSADWARQALEIDKENPAAFGLLGDAALELGDYDAAHGHYQKMLDLRPDLSSYSRGAQLLWVTGDARKAKWLMEKAIKTGAPYAENTTWCQVQLALMLFNEGALLPATQLVETALEKSPRHEPALLAAGRFAAARKDFVAALGLYQRALESRPSHEALVGLGEACELAGEGAEAARYYAEVEALHDRERGADGHDHMQMARFYADHDRNLIEALRMAEQRKLTRNVFEADVLAWVYYKNGHYPRAQAAIERALSQGTPDARIFFHAGMIAAASGDAHTARQHLQRALSLNPNFSPRHAPLAVQKLAELEPGLQRAVSER